MSFTSYAQNFEDVILYRALKHVEGGFYIDVGAQDPVSDSVSLGFYENGWRGVHVEPVPHYAARLRAARRDEQIVQSAIGTGRGQITFYELPETGLSTGDEAIAVKHANEGFTVNRIEVPCQPLSEILDAHKDRAIHWLKIDVEGMEQQVIESWQPSAVRPWVVVVESNLPMTQKPSFEKWEPQLLALGYEFVYFDGLNRFYLSLQHPELRSYFATGPNVFDDFVLSGKASATFCRRLNAAISRAEAEKADALARIDELEAERADALNLLVQSLTRGRKANSFAGVLAFAVKLIFNRSSTPFRKRVNNIVPSPAQRAYHAFRTLDRSLKKIVPPPLRRAYRVFRTSDRPLKRLALPPAQRAYRAFRNPDRALKKIVPPPVRRAYHAFRAPIRPILRKCRETVKRQFTIEKRRHCPPPPAPHRDIASTLQPVRHNPPPAQAVHSSCAAFIQPLPRGQRVVYVYVDHTVSCPTNTGVQRVTRGTATGLLAQNERVRFVKWDSATKQCVFISREEREYLAEWSGPAVDPTEWQFYHPAAEPPAPVPAHAMEENNWLIVPEVTHITTHPQPVTLDLILWARRHGLRSGFIFYDAIPLRREELAGMAPAHRQYMQHLRLADVVWPISKWSEADLLAYWAVAERATTTTMPEVVTFPLPGQAPDERTTEPRNSEPNIEPNILCVGSIEARKNQLGLVRAFQVYRKRNPDSKWKLTLVGNLHADVAEELNRAMLSDNAIRHPGHVSDKELAALYQTCRFTVFPSVEEGFGLPILESLWHAKPCLCANFGSMAEVAAGGGCLAVDVADPTALQVALETLIESPVLRQRLSDEAVHRQLHTWKEYAAQISTRIDRQADAIGRLGPIYYWVDATVSFPKNTGIQRVNRQLARTLMDAGAELVPVKWDASGGEFVRPEIHELEHLAKWNGPAVAKWAQDFPAQEASCGWFLMTELPLNYATSEQMQILSHARSLGLKCAAVFYDAIPWKMRDIYPEHYSYVHGEYMEVIGQYDEVLPISKLSASDLTNFLNGRLEDPRDPADYVHATLLPGEFSESSRVTEIQRPPHGEKPVTILCVGTLETRKNHLGMIEAFTRASQNTRVPLRLIIAGRDDCPTIADKINSYTSEYPCIVWEKDADDKRLRQLYEECDFTIYPSVEEGFGLPILESLWYAKPCICADFGAMAENAKDGGCLTVDVRDSEAFAATIVEMAKPEVRSRLAEEATKLKFKSWKDYAGEVAWRLARFAPGKQTSEPLTLSDEICARAHGLKLPKRPRLSVCISTYNRADWLAVNLKNWAEQCPAPIEGVEFLVCDNASTDHTPEVVKPYLARADFSYQRNPINVGMLGNLRETANHATGEYIWIIGDDDLIVPGAIDRILETISANPDTSLIYLNYAFTRIKDARTISDFGSFFANAKPIVPAERDIAGPIKTICARNENFFTAIYTLVFRRDHAINAYSQNTDGRPFSTMLTAIPTTYYVLNHMMEENGVWLGTPQIVVNMNVSWTKYIPLWILERIPEVYDLAERKGAAKEEIDRWRRHTLPSVAHYFDEIFQNQHEENARYLNPARLVHRFKHLPEFNSIQPKLEITYETARQRGHFAAKAPASQIFTQFDEHY